MSKNALEPARGELEPVSWVRVTYVRGSSRCVLPARFVGYEPNGDLKVEVEQRDTRYSDVIARVLVRLIRAEELVSVEDLTPAAGSDRVGS